MGSTSLLVIYLVLFASRFANVICDGDHAHAHAHDEGAGGAAASAAHATGPAGTASTVHTTTSDGAGNEDSFSSILSGLSPELISSLAGNPQIAQALRTSGAGDAHAASAAKAAAEAGGSVPPPPPTGGPGGAGGLPGGGGFPGGFPGGLPGGLGGLGGFGGGLGGFGGAPFPFFGGPFKNLHVSGDFGVYYPYIEKIIIVVGGGILLLVILALLTKAFSKGGLLFNMGSSLSEALAGSADVDIGPFHKSVAGAGAVSAGGGFGRPQQFGSRPQDIQLTQRVHNGLDQTF